MLLAEVKVRTVFVPSQLLEEKYSFVERNREDLSGLISSVAAMVSAAFWAGAEAVLKTGSKALGIWLVGVW